MPLSRTGISNFYDQIVAHDLSRDFQFRVLRLGPDKYDANIVGNDKIVYMTTATLPGRTVANKTLSYMGLQFNVPGAASYPGSDSWSVQFRVPQDFGIRNTLEQWSFDTFSDETSRGDYHVPCPDHTIELGLLNNRGKVIRQYRLFGVYLRELGAIDYDVTGDGAERTFDAQFAYQYWRLVPPDAYTQGGGVQDTISPVYEAYEDRTNGSDPCGEEG